MDDFSFGADVWGASTPTDPTPPAGSSSAGLLPPPPPPSTSLSTDDGFDDFDDFGDAAPAASAAADSADDDFGDFGDFDDAQDAPASAFVDGAFTDEPIAGPSAMPAQDWEPLRLRPRPPPNELRDQVDALLAPFWADADIDDYTTADDIRQVEGPNQTLVTAESREAHAALFVQQPPLAPTNWTRSRTRRQHLIALGIPVNLDEVLPRAAAKAMPALNISTRPMSAPPAPRGYPNGIASASTSRAGTPRSGTPVPGAVRLDTPQRLGLGPKPPLDEPRLEELLDTNPESLTLVPISKLESQLAEIRTQTANASALLTWLLQTRDGLQQDSETYNRLIGELIGQAQQSKGGTVKGRTPSRKGTVG